LLEDVDLCRGMTGEWACQERAASLAVILGGLVGAERQGEEELVGQMGTYWYVCLEEVASFSSYFLGHLFGTDSEPSEGGEDFGSCRRLNFHPDDVAWTRSPKFLDMSPVGWPTQFSQDFFDFPLRDMAWEVADEGMDGAAPKVASFEQVEAAQGLRGFNVNLKAAAPRRIESRLFE
jgi:hypothetical protein